MTAVGLPTPIDPPLPVPSVSCRHCLVSLVVVGIERGDPWGPRYIWSHVTGEKRCEVPRSAAPWDDFAAARLAAAALRERHAIADEDFDLADAELGGQFV